MKTRNLTPAFQEIVEEIAEALSARGKELTPENPFLKTGWAYKIDTCVEEACDADVVQFLYPTVSKTHSFSVAYYRDTDGDWITVADTSKFLLATPHFENTFQVILRILKKSPLWRP